MVDELKERLDQLVVKNWGLIEHLGSRRRTMIAEVLKAAHEAFSKAPAVKRLVESGASRCELTRAYFGIVLNNPGVEGAAETWAEFQPDSPQLTFQVSSSFKGSAATLGKSEVKRVKRSALAKLSTGEPDGWDDGSTRTCTVSRTIAFSDNSQGLDAFARRVADAAVAQLPVAEALTKVLAEAAPAKTEG